MSTKIQKITPEICKAITADINAALVAIAAKHGLAKLKCGNGTYAPEKFTVKVVAEVDQVNNPEMEVRNTEQSKFLGYSINIVGRQFVCKHGTCTIVALDINQKKYQIKATCSDGKTYDFPSNVNLKVMGEPVVTYDKAFMLDAKLNLIF